MSPQSSQAALAALNGVRPVLAHFDTPRSAEDLAADIIDLWAGAESALQALVGNSSLTGQQLVRAARQAEVITLEQAHALLEFLAARDRANRTSYKPTQADGDAAVDGFKALESALTGSRAGETLDADEPAAGGVHSAQGASGAAIEAATASTTSLTVRASVRGRLEAASRLHRPKIRRSADNRAATAGLFAGDPEEATPGPSELGAPWSSTRWPRRTRAAAAGPGSRCRCGSGSLVVVLLAGGGYFFFGRGTSGSGLTAGIDAMQNGQRERARGEFAKAVNADPNAATPHVFLARIAREEGDLATARAQLDTALRLDPKERCRAARDGTRSLREPSVRSRPPILRARGAGQSAGSRFTGIPRLRDDAAQSRTGRNKVDQRCRHRPMAGLPATDDAYYRTAALVIEFRNVGKIYKSLLGNSVKAVEEFSLTVVDGEILGIAGPNGAGKTTLIAMMLGYLRPTAGAVEINGLPARQYVERNGIGYLSELIAINPKWRAETALVRFATLAGISRSEIRQRVGYVIDLLGLDEHRNKKVKALSKGNLQRLGLAQALLRDEQILVLDEPTHGLDPVWTQRFRDIVEELRRPDRTILIASHNLDELQRLADRVAIIDRGRLQRVVSTGYENTAPAAGTRFRVTLASGHELIRAVFPQAEDAGRGEYDVTVRSIKDLNTLLADLISRGALIASVVPERSVLEQQFREAVGESQ